MWLKNCTEDPLYFISNVLCWWSTWGQNYNNDNVLQSYKFTRVYQSSSWYHLMKKYRKERHVIYYYYYYLLWKQISPCCSTWMLRFFPITCSFSICCYSSLILLKISSLFSSNAYQKKKVWRLKIYFKIRNKNRRRKQ